MKIGLDLRCLPSDGSDGAGVAHAARALCSRLVKDQTIEWIAFVVKNTTLFPSVIPAKAGIQFNGINFSGSPGLRRASSEDDKKRGYIAAQNDRIKVIELNDGSSKALRRAIKENPCDILFVPSGAVSFGLGVPAVPWVHDLIIFDHPKWFPQNWLQRQYTTRLFLRGIKRAPIVFAVSENTKQSIVRHSGISPSKVIVTHEGGDEQLRINNEQLTIKAKDFCLKKFGIKQHFILALGTIEPRKNLAMLIRAWKKAQKPLRFPPSKEGSGATSLSKKGRGGFISDLVIAGQDGWKLEDVTHEIVTMTIEQRARFHRIKKIDDDDKRQLILAASAVAVPSLDEGFGLVALEALQAGTDIVASNRGSLPEVVGTAGLLLDPEDEAAWSEAINNILDIERKKVFNSVGLGAIVGVLKGSKGFEPIMKISTVEGNEKRIEQSRKFSWDKTAEIILEGLKKIR